MPPALRDQLHRQWVDPSLIVKASPPLQRSDVANFVQRFILRESKPLAQRGARVHVGAAIEEELRQLGILPRTGAPGLRDDATKEWGVAAEAVRVDRGLRVHV